MDRILHSISRRVLSEDEDAKEEYQRLNLNPLRNSLQLIEMLSTLSQYDNRNSEKIDNSKAALNELMTKYLSSHNLATRKVKLQETMKDLLNNSSLDLFEKYDSFS